MRNFRLVVLTNPVAGREDEYNDWYSNRHLGDVIAIPGIVAAQRFKANAKVAGAETGSAHEYIAHRTYLRLAAVWWTRSRIAGVQVPIYDYLVCKLRARGPF